MFRQCHRSFVSGGKNTLYSPWVFRFSSLAKKCELRSFDEIPGKFDPNYDLGFQFTLGISPDDVFKRFFNDVEKYSQEMGVSNPSLYKCRVFNSNGIVALNPRIAKTMFKLEVSDECTLLGIPSLKDLFGPSTIVHYRLQEHYSIRRDILKAFGVSAVRQDKFINDVNNDISKHLNDLIAQFKIQNEFIDLSSFGKKLSWSIVCKLFFGFDNNNISSGMNDDLELEIQTLSNNDYLLDLLGLITRGVLDYENRNVAGSVYWIAKKAKDEFHDKMDQLLNKCDQLYKDNKLDTNCGIYKLLNETNILRECTNPYEWDRSDFMIQILHGSVDPVSSTLMGMIYSICKHESEYNQLKEELVSRPEDILNKKEIKYKDIDETSPLHWFVEEVMRLHSGAPFHTRQTIKDCQVDGYFIPKDTVLFFPAMYFQHDEKYFGNNSKEFDLYRFKKGQPNKDAMMPYGKGPRKCPGNHLGYIEQKLLVLNLLKNDVKFEIENGCDRGVKFELTPTYAPIFKAKLASPVSSSIVN